MLPSRLLISPNNDDELEEDEKARIAWHYTTRILLRYQQICKLPNNSKYSWKVLLTHASAKKCWQKNLLAPYQFLTSEVSHLNNPDQKSLKFPEHDHWQNSRSASFLSQLIQEYCANQHDCSNIGPPPVARQLSHEIQDLSEKQNCMALFPTRDCANA